MPLRMKIQQAHSGLCKRRNKFLQSFILIDLNFKNILIDHDRVEFFYLLHIVNGFYGNNIGNFVQQLDQTLDGILLNDLPVLNDRGISAHLLDFFQVMRR